MYDILLNSITRVLLQPNKKEITTYKLLRPIDEKLISMYFRPRKDSLDFFTFPPIGEWISCYIDHTGKEWTNINLMSIEDRNEYPIGFHCFLKLDEAKKVYKEFKRVKHFDIILCKCKSKYRMVFGTEKFSFVKLDEIICADMVVCRGLKIIEML